MAQNGVLMMSMKMWMAALALAISVAACGGKGEIGESCDTPSATDECVDGAVCTNESGDNRSCRKLCTDQAQCAANEGCNGISGSNLKSCQPG